MTTYEDLGDVVDPRSRTITYKGTTFNVFASDPYGLWTVKIPKKQTPVALQGSYTSLDEAEKAIILYANNTKSI